jgi:hypothetical protein
MFDATTLASLVAYIARNDRTVPLEGNLRVGWDTEQLFRFVERLIITGDNNPGAYAQIALEVQEQVKNDLPEALVLAKIAFFNSTRRLPIIPAREGELLAIVRELEELIPALPPGTRRARCENLFGYNKGEFFKAFGRFDLARQEHLAAAKKAEASGNIAEAAISLFQADMASLKDSLRNNTPATVNIDLLERGLARLIEAVRGTDLQVLWAEGNGPAHLIEAHVLLGLPLPLSHSLSVESVQGAAQKLGKSWEPIANFVTAIDDANREKPQAHEELEAIASSQDVPERRAMALLVLARNAMNRNEVEEARRIVARMPIEGTQHIIAIANRLLER